MLIELFSLMGLSESLFDLMYLVIVWGLVIITFKLCYDCAGLIIIISLLINVAALVIPLMMFKGIITKYQYFNCMDTLIIIEIVINIIVVLLSSIKEKEKE